MAGAADAAASGPLLGRVRWAGAACGRTEIPGIRCARAVHLVSGVGAGCPAAGQGDQMSGDLHNGLVQGTRASVMARWMQRGQCMQEKGLSNADQIGVSAVR